MREEKEERGGEDRAAVYVSFGTALRRRPVDNPAWKLCGLWTHAHTHNPHTARSSYWISQFIWRYIFMFVISSCVCCSGLCACRRCDWGLEQTTISCAPELASVFILRAVTCCSFRRDCLLSHGAHSALFINAQTQEVLFIRQSDRDQWGVREHACSKGQLCETSEDIWGFCWTFRKW